MLLLVLVLLHASQARAGGYTTSARSRTPHSGESRWLTALCVRQSQSAASRRLRTAAMVLGVAVGCLLGMTSLLFMDLEKVERLKKVEGMRTMFQTIVEDGNKVMQCDRMSMYLLAKDASGSYLIQYGRASGKRIQATSEEVKSAFTTVSKGKDTVTPDDIAGFFTKIGYRRGFIEPALPKDPLTYDGWIQWCDAQFFSSTGSLARTPIREGGSKAWALEHGEPLRVDDMYQESRWMRRGSQEDVARSAHNYLDQYTGFRTKSLLLVPIKDKETDRVLGLIELQNKRSASNAIVPFADSDAAAVTMLSAHCSAFLQNCGINDIIDETGTVQLN
jgi:hypothetical protein